MYSRVGERVDILPLSAGVVGIMRESERRFLRPRGWSEGSFADSESSWRFPWREPAKRQASFALYARISR